MMKTSRDDVIMSSQLKGSIISSPIELISNCPEVAPAFRAFISRLNATVRNGLAQGLPWTEPADRSSSISDSISDADQVVDLQSKRADEEPVDPKRELEDRCKAPCTRPLKEYQGLDVVDYLIKHSSF